MYFDGQFVFFKYNNYAINYKVYNTVHHFLKVSKPHPNIMATPPNGGNTLVKVLLPVNALW